MKTLMMRCLSAVALLLLYTNASAQSLRCPSPLPPLNVQNAIPIAPPNPSSNDPLFYWSIGEEFYLDSFDVQRSGTAITVNVYIANRGEDMMLPPNCLQIPIGVLSAGTYSLTVKEFHRFTSLLQYPITPTFTSSRTLIVESSSASVPTQGAISYSTLTLLLLGIGSFFARRVRY